MSDQDQGFTVKDRRFFTDEGDPRPEEPEAPRQAAQPAQPAPEPGPEEPPEPQERPAGGQGNQFQLPPVDFSGLILSLSHTAALHLGLIPDPHADETHFEPALARHAIDTIAMLKEKTQGNLTQDEERLITGALTELRLAYVQLTK